MPNLPTIFKQCKPRREVLGGELPDAIFAAELWHVFTEDPETHEDYLDPMRFFAGTHPTVNLKILIKDVAERLSGVGGAPIYRLETGFGGGKTHSLIGAFHVARHGAHLADALTGFEIRRLPAPGETAIAAFVGEESDPLNGKVLTVAGDTVRVFTPWGQIALLAGGIAGYNRVKENDVHGVVPDRTELKEAMGDKPVLIVIDELVKYMARCFAMPQDGPRSRLNSQWSTFFQVIFGIAANRPRTSLLLTLPTEKDADRAFVGEMKQYVAAAWEIVQECMQTAGRQVPCIDPTQSFERAAVLVRRLFDSVDTGAAGDIAQEFARYYQQQHDEGAQIDSRALQTRYLDEIRMGYPFHPELIRLFAERLADIREFHATRGALRLFARTIRCAWERRKQLGNVLLLQPQHIDLSRSDIRSEILDRLNRSAFRPGLESDVVKAQGDTYASEVEAGWPWKAATESAIVAFLHSLPDGSKGVTPAEVALAIGRPGVDLGYVARALEETERRAWYMRREGDHFIFRTRASVNKRYQERLSGVQPGETRETLDNWVQEVYSGFTSFQVIPFPLDQTAIKNTSDRVRLAIIHYDKECGAVGGGDRLNFTKSLFTKAGADASGRTFKNNIVFLLAESSRIDGLKDAVRSLLAWEGVLKDIESEQNALAENAGVTFRSLKEQAKRGDAGVPAEFMALESDFIEVKEDVGKGELNVRTRLLEGYRVLAFPKRGDDETDSLFSQASQGPLLECYRVDFGETPTGPTAKRPRQAVAEGPILQCLRQNNKLVPEPTHNSPVVLDPGIVRRPPLWNSGERRLSTEEIWERIRKEPEAPMVLRQTDLLPTLRAGLTKEPEAHWVYYSQPDKKVYTRDNVDLLSPVIAANHYLYDPTAAIADRVMPVTVLSAQQVWDYLWPREGADHAGTAPTADLLANAVVSAHFPVLPDPSLLWQAIQEGARENRWVLYLRGPNLAIGAQDMNEWPGMPRFDKSTEVWTYEAALDQKIYPRKAGKSKAPDLSAGSLKAKCWPANADELTTEDLERFARGIWTDLSRPQLETVLRDGLRDGVWATWQKRPEEVFYTSEDSPRPAVQVGAAWSLVQPASALAQQLDLLRPGRGPQAVERAGTPREALTAVWEELSKFRDVRLACLTLAAADRDTFDNTLVATWADRPPDAQAHVSVLADGRREVGGKEERVKLEFEGRFEEVRSLLAPIWPFQSQGELASAIRVTLTFPTPVRLDQPALKTYRTAIMNANQGALEVHAKPARGAAVSEGGCG